MRQMRGMANNLCMWILLQLRGRREIFGSQNEFRFRLRRGIDTHNFVFRK